MDNKTGIKKGKARILLTIGIVLIAAVGSILIVKQIQKPEKITEIKIGETYSAFLGTPDKSSDRYYIELRKDGTYSLIYDATKHNQEYGEEDASLSTYFVVGTYEKRDNAYILMPLEGVCIVFDSSEGVEKNEIPKQNSNINAGGIRENFGEMCVSVFQDKEGYYLLGYPSSDGFNYDENGTTYLKIQSSETYGLYESDMEDIPDTREAFRAQFTVVDSDDDTE